jgi:hypothetical protein
VWREGVRERLDPLLFIAADKSRDRGKSVKGAIRRADRVWWSVFVGMQGLLCRWVWCCLFVCLFVVVFLFEPGVPRCLFGFLFCFVSCFVSMLLLLHFFTLRFSKCCPASHHETS